jgi:hypothetical protein
MGPKVGSRLKSAARLLGLQERTNGGHRATSALRQEQKIMDILVTADHRRV